MSPMATNDEQLKELVTIRKLMILGLMRSGMTQGELGAALGVDRTVIGRMFPSGALSEMRKKPATKKKNSSSDGPA
jgi:hypothetical protein